MPRDRYLKIILTVIATASSSLTTYGSFVDGPGFRDIDVAIWTTADAMEPVDLRLGIALTRIAGYPVDVRIINQAPVP